MVAIAMYHWKWKCVNITLGQLDENESGVTLIKFKIPGKKEDFRFEFWVSENLFG